MKNSPVEIIAIGHDETSDEIFFSMTVKSDSLKSWLQSDCGETSTLGRHLNEALLVESQRLFDVGQYADIGDVVAVTRRPRGTTSTGSVTSIGDDYVGIDGVKYSLDECSVRYADGKLVELFGELHEDLLLDLA